MNAFLIEEHHEAFAVIYSFVKEHCESAVSLVHIDHHSDLGVPKVNDSLHDCQHFSFDQLREYALRELTMGNFIVPLFYLGVIDNMIWIDQEGPADEDLGSHWSMASRSPISDGVLRENGSVVAYVRSKKLRGQELVVEEDNPLIRKIKDPSRSSFTVQACLLQQALSFQTNKKCILNIDLDYFSCAGDPYYSKTVRIQITKKEFEKISSNHDPVSLLFPSISLEEEEGNYFAILSKKKKDYSSVMKVSRGEIVKRVQALGEYLNRIFDRVEAIVICRSRLSGFTPNDQWQFIEKEVLTELREIFPLELVDLTGT